VTLDDLPLTGSDLQGKWILLDSAGSDRRYYTPDVPARWTEQQVLTREVEVGRTPEEQQKEAERYRGQFDIRRRLAKLDVLGVLHRSKFRGGVLGWTESVIGEEIPPEVLQLGGLDPLPNVILSDPDYALIYRNVMAGVEVILEFDLRSHFIEDDPLSRNTIGEIRGTDLADEIVLIGAHLDSWQGGTGAVDNGAGSIVALEAMRILVSVNAQPRRTIRIGLWSGEEPERLDHTGLFGSVAYAEAHANELGRTSVYLNLDDGTGRIRGIWEQNNSAAAKIIEEIMRPLQDLGVVGLKPGFFVGSDDLTFAAAGVPSFPFVHDQPFMGYHSEADNFDEVEIEDLKQAATVVAVTAYHLAMRNGRLPR
jgi:hypothetical protein